MEYLDFDLKIGPRTGRNRYSVSAHSATAGEATGSFLPPLRDEELENFVLKIGLTRRGVRRIDSPQWRAAQDFGQKLFQAVFTADVRSCFISAHNDAVRQGKGLRIKLSLDAPVLANYPWEFLYDPGNANFLSLVSDMPVVRYIELARPSMPLIVTPPLRILAVASSPKGWAPIDIRHEQQNLAEALDDMLQAGQIELEWLPAASLETLRSQLLKREYHIFHFLGHGGFDESKEDGILIFEGEEQSGERVSGERLAYFLRNHRTLRLAVLNACEGARNSSQDPFAGTAVTLVRTGNLPAVVAMQFEITDSAAIDFTKGFYSAIALGQPVDAAVVQGRQAIFSRDNDVEWGTPVLYLRAPDGLIFKLDQEQLARDKEQRARLAKEQAEQARRAAEQAEMERREREIAEAKRAAAEKAEEERIAAEKEEQERLEKERVQAEGLAAEKAETERLAQEKEEQDRLKRQQAEAERVAAEMKQVERLAREKEAQERLRQEQAEKERLANQRAAMLTELLQRGEASLAAKQWTTAIDLFEQLAREDPAYEATVGPLIREAKGAEAEEVAQRLAEEKAKAERLDAEQAEKDQLARHQAEQVRLAMETAERERELRDEAEAKRVPAEKDEAERLAREKEEREREARPPSVADQLTVREAASEPAAAKGEVASVPSQKPRTRDRKSVLWIVPVIVVAILIVLGVAHFALPTGSSLPTYQPVGQPLTGHTDQVLSVAFSPDGKTLASGSNDGTIILWDVSSRQPVGQPLVGHTDHVSSIAFSPDGKTLASGSKDGAITGWDVGSQQLLGQPVYGHAEHVSSVAFSPDGKTLAIGDGNGNIIFWDVSSHEVLGQPLTGHKDAVGSVVFSPDGKTLASGSNDGTIVLWDVDRHQPIGQPLTGHTDHVLSVAFSPDGKTLASGSDDGNIILWDVSSHQPLGQPLKGRADHVLSVAFSPDGKTLAAGNSDGTIILWDVSSRQPGAQPLTGHKDAVASVVFSPDGETLASGSWDKTVILWNVSNH